LHAVQADVRLEMLLNENGGVDQLDQVQMGQRDDRPSERSAKVESVQFAVPLWGSEVRGMGARVEPFGSQTVLHGNPIYSACHYASGSEGLIEKPVQRR
jgi:hypothetical protein